MLADIAKSFRLSM